MGKFERHLGKTEKISLGDEELVLKPLGLEDMTLFFKAIKVVSTMDLEDSASKDEAEATRDFLNNLDPEGMEIVSQLIRRVLWKSYPEESEESLEGLSVLGMKYSFVLITKIFEMNMQQPSEKKARLIEQIKKGHKDVEGGINKQP